MPATQTAGPVSVGDLLKIFESNTRENVRTLLDEYGRGVEKGGAAAFNRTTRYWQRAYGNSAKVNEALRGQRKGDLSGLPPQLRPGGVGPQPQRAPAARPGDQPRGGGRRLRPRAGGALRGGWRAATHHPAGLHGARRARPGAAEPAHVRARGYAGTEDVPAHAGCVDPARARAARADRPRGARRDRAVAGEGCARPGQVRRRRRRASGPAAPARIVPEQRHAAHQRGHDSGPLLPVDRARLPGVREVDARPRRWGTQLRRERDLLPIDRRDRQLRLPDRRPAVVQHAAGTGDQPGARRNARVAAERAV